MNWPGTLRIAATMLIAVPGCGPAGAQPRGAQMRDDQPRTPMVLGDIFRLRTVSDPQIAPDGRWIAYVQTRADVRTDRRLTTVRLVRPDGGDDHPVGDGIAGDSQPRWWGNDRLAYVAADDAAARIIVLDLKTGTRTTVTPGALRPLGLAWSPDGRRLAFLASRSTPSPEPQVPAPAGATWARPPLIAESSGFQTITQAVAPPVRLDLYTLDAAPGATPRQVMTEPVAYTVALVRPTLAWTPDGREIVFAANRGRDFWRNTLGAQVDAVDVATGRARRLSPDGSSSNGPVVSPDGRTVAFLCWDRPRENFIRHDICLADRAGGAVRHLPNRADQRLWGLRWSADGRSLIGGIDQGGRVLIARFDLTGGYRVLVETGSGDLSAYTSAPDLSIARDGTIAYVASDATRPADIALLVRGMSRPRIVTATNAALLAARDLATVEEIRFPLPGSGQQIPALVWRPPHYDPARRYPLFVLMHGGRSLVYGPDFDINAELIAAQGYVIVMPNYRSSGGFGTDFANSLPGYPAGLEQEVAGAVDAMVARGGIDPSRLYLGGGSGGGVITGWTIGRDDRFKAAAMWFATVDWASNSLEAATGFTSDYDSFGPDPLAGRAKEAARSPLTFIGRVKTPTLLVVGDQDRITPMSQSMMFFNGLQFRNIPSQLQIVPGEPHGVRVRPSHEIALLQSTLAWFARFGSGVAPTPLDIPAVAP